MTDRTVRLWMHLHAGEFETATQLAEATALEFDHDDWLDDELHPVWDWALEFVPGD